MQHINDKSDIVGTTVKTPLYNMYTSIRSNIHIQPEGLNC